MKYKPDIKVIYSTKEIVRALRAVDEVVVYQGICPEFLQNIEFDVLDLGKDHTSERFMISAN